jgi:hypothetical protein
MLIDQFPFAIPLLGDTSLSESCIRGRGPYCTPSVYCVLNPTYQHQQSVTTFLLPSRDGSENEAENYMVEKTECFET